MINDEEKGYLAKDNKFLKEDNAEFFLTINGGKFVDKFEAEIILPEGEIDKEDEVYLKSINDKKL